MKIRSGFVSNSSSTSYIVRLHRENITTCPCCGITDNRDLQILQEKKEGDYDDTYMVSVSSKNIMLEEIDADIKFYMDILWRISKYGDEAVPRYYDGDKTIYAEETERNLREAQEKKEKYKSMEKDLYYVNINNHDELSKGIYERLIEKKIFERINCYMN